MKTPFDYAVAISFAGEDREAAEAFALELTKLGVSVFYDDYERSLMWGRIYRRFWHPSIVIDRDIVLCSSPSIM